MIRYVDISKSLGEDGYNFAWWDTINSEWITYDMIGAWETWEDFVQDASPYASVELLERFERLYKGNQ